MIALLLFAGVMVPGYLHPTVDGNAQVFFTFSALSTGSEIEDAGLGNSELAVSSLTLDESVVSLSAPAEIQAIIDEITSSNYRNHVNRLCNSFGSRRFGTEGNDGAVEFLAEFFEEAGLEVGFHEFGANGRNVVATLPGGNILNDECIIIGAHLDTSPDVSPGADDNASGVAAVMEIARAMAQYIYNYTIIFVAFNAEEQGLIGSHAYMGSLVTQGVSVAVGYNFDMIMWDDPSAPADQKVDIVHNGNGSGDFANHAANIGQDWLSAPIKARYNPLWVSSDHFAFWSRNIPAVWFFEHGGNENTYIHSIQDSPSRPDYSYSQGAMVAKTAAAALADFATIVSTNPGFPNVSFVSPNPNESVTPSGNVPLILSIEDNYNDVSQVELSFDDGPWINAISGFNSTHCTYLWNTSSLYGPYTIRARIVDAEGWIGSASETFRVDRGIFCLVTAPTSDETIAQGSQYTIWVNTSDPDGGPIIYALVRINGSTWNGMHIAIPNQLYYYNWTVSGWGPVTVEAKAADTNGCSNQSLISATIARFIPTVSNVSFRPLQPLDTDEVQITADIFQDSRGSGINMVLVFYSVEYSLWKTRLMTLEAGNTWSVTLDPFPARSQVRFYIDAFDNLGNIGRDDNNGHYFNFTVNSNLVTLLVLVGGIAGIVGIVTGFYLIRRRRRSRPTPST